MEDKKLIAKKRDLEGSSNARRLRGAGTLPGVVYGGGKEPAAVQVDAHEFELILHHHSSESLLIDVNLEGEGDISVFVKDVQHHPVSGDLLHVDLLRVEAGKVISVDIDLELVGEAAGVLAGGVVDQVMHSIGVECLPVDLVEKLEVDISGLEIGQSLQVSELNFGDKYKLLVDEEAIVVAVHGPNSEEEADEEDTEPEVIGEKAE